jgi:hypothetical protein
MLIKYIVEVKSSGGYSLFNFDDIPDFEPLDSTVGLLRNRKESEDAFQAAMKKLLEVLVLFSNLLL